MKTITRFAGLIVLALSSAMSSAQPLAAAAPAPAASPGFDGNWQALIDTPTGRQYRADLALTPEGGTWQLGVRNANDACQGLPTPVRWRPIESGGIELTLLGSKALQGCRDTVISLMPASDATLQGRIASGIGFTLSRR